MTAATREFRAVGRLECTRHETVTEHFEIIMRCRVPIMLLAAIFTGCQSGCASTSFPIGPDQSDLDIRQGTPVAAPDTMYGLQPGKYGEFLVSSLPSEGASAARRTTIAGQIVTMSADEVVLTDCIRLEEPEQLSRPPFARVPYVNRLFKVTGVEAKSTPVSGEVRLPKSSILAATSIPEAHWPAYREGPHFERVGVDFDFNVSSNEDARSM